MSRATSIEATLKQRAIQYGDFVDVSCISQNIKKAVKTSHNWEVLPDNMKESLEMIASKIGRILSGEPSHADNWHDIAGYAKLIEDYLS